MAKNKKHNKQQSFNSDSQFDKSVNTANFEENSSNSNNLDDTLLGRLNEEFQSEQQDYNSVEPQQNYQDTINSELDRINYADNANELPVLKDDDTTDFTDFDCDKSTSKNQDKNINEGNSTAPPEPPVVEPGTFNNKPMPKANTISKKKKIIAISVVAIVLVIGLTLSIVLPIVFFYKDKIMVKQASDFANTSKGTYFVLSNDVIVEGDLDLSKCNYNIDLNGHSLRVNGTLIYKSTEKITVNIGVNKKGVYVKGGSIDINSLDIDLPNGTINLESTVQAGTIKIVANSVQIFALTAVEDIVIDAKKVVFNDKITTATGKNVIINNSEDFVTKANIEDNTLVVNNSNATILGSVANLNLDATSQAIVYGSVKGGIKGGKKVVMMKGHYCEEYEDIEVLALDRESITNYTIKNCDNVVYIENLEKPSYIDVQEMKDGKIYCSIEKIPNATKYMFSVDGAEFEESYSNVFDITEQLKKSGAGTHYVKAYAVGDFDINNLGGKEIVYRNSDFVSCNYAYSITLETPNNLTINKEGDKTKLTFNSVAFADYYEVIVNGVALPKEQTLTTTVDITNYVEKVGQYTIQVIAHSNIAEIKKSNIGFTSHITTQKLGKVTNLIGTYEDNKVSLTWTASENAKSYIIYINDKAHIIGSTSLTSMSFVLENVLPTDKVCVVALGYGNFYKDSDVAEILIINTPQ